MMLDGERFGLTGGNIVGGSHVLQFREAANDLSRALSEAARLPHWRRVWLFGIPGIYRTDRRGRTWFKRGPTQCST